jgi:hypothetical protein
MSIASVQLGATETEIISPASETAILSILFCNIDSSDRTITLYAYADGGSAGDGTTILKNYIIPAYNTFIWTGDEKLVLDTDDVISGLADSASTVTATVNYKGL